MLVDVGQEFDLEQSQERGYAAGADDVLLVDRREAFANEQCAQALKTNALYEGKYPLISALSRPVIAGAVAELAQEIGAEAAVHGCTGKGNDQLRFELAFRANYPGVKVIAPLRDRVWTRDEEIEYALAKGIPISVTRSSPFSFDENLFGRSIEAGVLEDPWEAPPEEPYLFTSDPDSRARADRGRDRLRGRAAGLARRRAARARRADRPPEPAGRRVRHRADRHDREPRDRDQEPRGLRGAGRDDADRGAPGARGHRPDEGRARDQAVDRGPLGAHGLRRALVLSGAGGAGRVRRPDPGARHRRGAACSSEPRPPW